MKLVAIGEKKQTVQSNGSQGNISILVDYGLSNAQAKIFLALLSLGSASVREIAHISGVARPDTYRAIAGLVEIGVVEKIVCVPVVYSPVSVVDAVGILMARKKREQVDLCMRSSVLIRAFETGIPKVRDGLGGEFVLLKGLDAIEHKLQMMLDRVERQSCIMVAWSRIHRWFDANSEFVEKALRRDVEIQIVTSVHGNMRCPKEFATLLSSPKFEVHSVARLPVWLRIDDGKNLILISSTHTTPPQYSAILTSNPSLVELAQFYFKAFWSTSTKLKP
jgi:sugar-specific transcriptional regulator TrmB